jgi:hypothetical protein
MIRALCSVMASFRKDMAEVADEHDVRTPRVVRSNDVVDARTDGNSVYYNPQFTNQLRADGGDGATQFVAAHELEHIQSQNPESRGEELAADRFAARTLARTDGDVSAIMEVFGHLAEPLPEQAHPATGVRERQAVHAFEQEQRFSDG